MVLLGKIMILQGVGHQISCLGVCYANNPKKGGYTTPAPALDLTTSLRGDFGGSCLAQSTWLAWPNQLTAKVRVRFMVMVWLEGEQRAVRGACAPPPAQIAPPGPPPNQPSQPPPPPLPKPPLQCPPCDIPSGCCSFTGPWTVTRSALRMLRRVAAFCRLLQPVLLLVSFPRSRSPVIGVLGLC